MSKMALPVHNVKQHDKALAPWRTGNAGKANRFGLHHL